ncbi:MAG TPA: FkbM family methyltransferase [Candidatus Babeliaceae bacterium]|nr:FkbM family methyltransferase [Candidatus Babeliaceae bacterium]
MLEIGANNGTDLSNSKLLIENGWAAHLVEPSSVFVQLSLCHSGNKNIHIYNYGIGEREEKVTFWESGHHFSHRKDHALLSTTDYAETKKWRKTGVQFEEKTIELVSFERFWRHAGLVNFDFISIDVEGLDWQVLKQIDLDATGCRCLCIEFNNNGDLRRMIEKYCETFGLKLAAINNENLIFIR